MYFLTYKDKGVIISRVKEEAKIIRSYEGKDITIKDNKALREPSFYGHLQVVKYLVSLGADISANIDYVVKDGSRKGYLY